MTALGLLVRWAHLASGVVLLGTFSLFCLAPRRLSPTAERWERQAFGLARLSVLVALATALGALALATADFEGRAGAAFEPDRLWPVLEATRFGAVWLVRTGLLLLLAVFVFLVPPGRSGADRFAVSLEGALLAAGALGATAWAGHAAAVEPGTLLAVSAHALHVLAAGVWMGGLLPLARLLWLASRPAGLDARPWAVLTARRFSAQAFGAVGALVLTGAWNAWVEVGDLAGLIGTPYGRLLVAKLGLLGLALGLAVLNRRRLLPALSGDAEAVGRPAMRRLAQTVLLEALLGFAILAFAATMAGTPPGRHAAPTWPLPFRFSWGAAAHGPGLRPRVLAGALLAALGLLGALLARRAGRPAVPLTIAASSTLVAACLALPPLVVDAHPTTFRRSPVPWDARSIAAGARLFARECEGCHAGPGGDPLGRSTVPPLEGDLFWAVTAGRPRAGMPGFAGRLSDDSRWDLVNFLRARAAARALGSLGAEVVGAGPSSAAPDFTFAVGPSAVQSLGDYRGRRVVLLVLFSLPQSRPRIDELARGWESLAVLGAEVILVPVRASGDILRRLGARPPIFFPVATDGAAAIVSTYELFRPPGAGRSHLEFLIDRRGALRARSAPDPTAPAPLDSLLGQIRRLNAEPGSTPAPEEHLH